MAKNNSAISSEAVQVNETPTALETKTTEKPNGCSDGFYCYIGPSIKGVILHGTIYRGTRSEALKAAAAAIEKQPLVKTLIVSGDDLPEARLKVKKSGNALYLNYRKIAEKQ